MIAVIVINYKSQTRTVEFVRNETAKISLPHKVVIVNNGATPESDGYMAVSLNAQVVRPGESFDKKCDCFIISNPENSGFAKGNNIGACFARDSFGADYFLFSNNDIKFLDDRLVDTLVEKLDSTLQAGMIGPRVIGPDGKLQSPEPYMSFWDRHIWMYLCTPFMSKSKKACRFHFDYSETAREGFHYKLMGSFFMVRCQDYFNCGMMDEHTFLYCEEPILTERMKSIGLKPYYCPSVSVLHDHGSTISTHFSSARQKDMLFESECYYYRTYCKTSGFQIWLGKLVHKIIRLSK